MVPSLPYDDEQPVAAKKMSNDEIRIGPTTRARAKLLEQQVNSLLVENDVCVNQNFILPKSLHLCMIRFIDNTSVEGEGEHEKREKDLFSSSRHRTSDGAPDVRQSPAAERPTLIGNPVPPRQIENVGCPKHTGRPTQRTTDNDRKSDPAKQS